MEYIKLKNVIFKRGIIAIFLGVIIDIFVKSSYIPYLEVNKEYIYNVFTGICTVSTLGSAFLAIYINISTNSILGFSLKEVFAFKSVNIKLSNVIAVSLSSVLVSIPLLAYECATSLTVIAVFVIIYILFYTSMFWNFISNDAEIKKLIYDEIKQNSVPQDDQIFIDWINKWFPEMENAIKNQNEQIQTEYMALISKIVEKSEEIENSGFRFRLKYWLDRVFLTAIDYLGIVEAYQKITGLGGKEYFDEYSAILKSIERQKYYDAEEISKMDYSGNINDILYNSDLNKNIKTYILYNYFNSIASNNVISDDLRFCIINDYFREICSFTSDVEDVRTEAILKIYRNWILENEDVGARENIYLSLIRELSIQNPYNNNEFFIQTIAQMARSLYFYSKLETETLKRNYREKLQELIGLMVNSKDNVLISLPRIIETYANKVVYSLTSEACNTDMIDNFDYFPEGFGAKTVVGTMETKIQFAFMVYSIHGYNYSLFPLEEYFSKIEISLDKKICIYRAILDLFNDDGTLKEHVSNSIVELQEFLGSKNIIPSGLLKQNFDNYTNRSIECLALKREEISADINLEDLKAKFNELLVDHPMIELDTELSLEGANEYQVNPHYDRILPDYTLSVAREIQYAVKDAVNKLIEETLYEVRLEFNKSGVINLLDEIRKQNIIFRNYTFIDDWAIAKEVRDSDEYKSLSDILKQIPYENTREINQLLFLAKPGIKFNAEIVKYIQQNLSDEQCNKYIESKKVADARYKIDGVVYDKDQAIHWVKTNIIIVSAVFKLNTNIDKDSGFRVEFQYIHDAKDRGIIAGYPDGSLHPEKLVTKIEFAIMLIRALGVRESELSNYTTTSFKDIYGFRWAINHFSYCEKKGILIADEAGNIVPGKIVNTKEAIIMALYSKGFSSLDEAEKAGYLTDEDVMKFYPDYVAETPVNRGKTAQILYELISSKQEGEHEVS